MQRIACNTCNILYYTSMNINSLESQDCPNCNRDSYAAIQSDIDYMYKTFGYSAIKSVIPRLDRLWNRQFLIKYR